MKALLFSIALCASFLLPAQDSQPFKIDYTIQSEAFGDERKISVYLPPSYYRFPDDKFTVTYVLDGHHNPFIDMGAKIIEYGTYNYKYTPTIVVGIHAKQRGWEFSPQVPGDEESDYKGGRAPELQKHFEKEVFPLIDSLYPRQLPFKNIVGHSSGGVFVLYTLFGGKKDLFDGYIAISPALRSDQNYIFEAATSKLKKGESFKKFLFCSAGTVGNREEIFGGSILRLDSLLKANPNHGFIWNKHIIEGTGHWSVVAPSFNQAMLDLTRAFRVDEYLFAEFAKNNQRTMAEQLDAFYDSKEKEFGFTEVPLAGYIAMIGREFSGKDQFETAIEIYDWGIKKYPNNLTLHKRKGFTLTRMNKNEEAHKVFKRGMEILAGLKDEISEEDYQDELKYLEKKLTQTTTN